MQYKMKTIQKLKQEISEIKHRIETEEMKQSQQTKLRNQIQFLNVCIKYLEANPDKNFISAEVDRISEKINLRMSGFKENPSLAKSEVYKMRTEYERMYEIPKLRTQLRTLRFLLVA